MPFSSLWEKNKADITREAPRLEKKKVKVKVKGKAEPTAKEAPGQKFNFGKGDVINGNN